MNKNIFISLFILLFLSNVFSDTTSDINKKTSIEKYRETLAFGIEDEVIGILKDLGTTPKEELFPLLKERYNEATQITTKTALINFFEECEKLPQDIINTLYEEAKAEPDSKKVHSTLLDFLAKKGSNEQLMLLIERLDYNDSFIKSAAADALAKAENPDLVQPLLDRLKLSDTDYEKFLSDDIKGKIILSFGKMKSKEAVDYLRNIISNPANDKILIMYGMVSLAEIGDVDSIDLINKNLESEEARIQEYAGYALSLFKSEKVIPIYKKMFRSNNEKIRAFACQGVVLNNDTGSLKILTYKFQNDPSVNIKKEALQSLMYMGNAGINELKSFMKDKEYTDFNIYAISEAVRKKPNIDNVNFLLNLYETFDEKKREIIAKHTVNGTSNKLDPIIKKLLESEDYKIRINAIKSVYLIKESSLWNEVKSISDNDKVDIVKKTAKEYLELRNK